MKKITVIIPLYNKAKYISRAIDSVLSQSFQNFEIIVVDDGSSDEGPAIIKGYEESRIRLIRQQNAGPGAARNRGLAESNCPLIAFLDADDEWMPQFLESCYKALSENPDCDIAAAAYYLGENAKDISVEFKKRGMKDGPWKLNNKISDKELKNAIYILHSSSTLCKRTVIDKYGGFYTKNNCRLGEDYYLWLQIMLNHKIYRILQPLWHYHIEVSQLGNGSLLDKCNQPFLTDASSIKNNCPPEFISVLERWLAIYALGLANELSCKGQFDYSERLVKNFPLMKSFGLEYFKLRTKMIAPRLIPMVRFFKQFARQA